MFMCKANEFLDKTGGDLISEEDTILRIEIARMFCIDFVAEKVSSGIPKKKILELNLKLIFNKKLQLGQRKKSI